MITRQIRIASTGGSFDAHMVQLDAARRPTIVVLHEVPGVNADMRSTCEELAAAGFTAICPDLSWRQHEAFDVDAGVRDAEAAVTAARMLRGTGRVGVMGFCLGGLLTFLTAARTRVDAAVVLFGGRIEEFLNEAPDVDAPLQMHLAEKDEFMTKAAQQQIVGALAENPRVEFHTYPGCQHGFSPLSRERTLEFFKRHL